MVSSPRNGRCINFYSVRGRGLFSRLRARRSTDFSAYNDTKLLSFLQFPNSLLLHPYIKTMQWPCPKAVIVSGEVCMEGRGEGGPPARRLRKYGGKWGKRRRLRIRKLSSVLCLHELPRLCRTLRERKLRLREPVSM